MKIFSVFLILLIAVSATAEVSLTDEFDYCQIIYGNELAPKLCSVPAAPSEMLKDPFDAFNARFKLLMGYELSRDAYNKRDPNMPLDFSKAPKLDLIIVDTLQILRDFVGFLHIRMLKHHLHNGTKVYFMTSRALQTPREMLWLMNFRRKYPQLRFSLYQKGPENLSFREILGILHRNNHVKALLTYSKDHPEHNSFIVGGRNITEQYFYTQRNSRTSSKILFPWNRGKFYKWTYFDDFDFKITDTAATKALARSLIAFHEDRRWDEYQKPLLHPLPSNTDLSFYLSYPFKDGKGDLEELYVEWIDSAKRSLQITSPYVNLTQKIKQALLRAQARGVNIHIVTNLELDDDVLDFILKPGMKLALRRVAEMFKIDYYTYPQKILHVKSVLIDDEKLILGSVNLNQRSFIHDSEIVYVMNDPTALKEFKVQYKTLITPLLKRLTPKDVPTKSIMQYLIIPLLPEL